MGPGRLNPGTPPENDGSGTVVGVLPGLGGDVVVGTAEGTLHSKPDVTGCCFDFVLYKINNLWCKYFTAACTQKQIRFGSSPTVGLHGLLLTTLGLIRGTCTNIVMSFIRGVLSAIIWSTKDRNDLGVLGKGGRSVAFVFLSGDLTSAFGPVSKRTAWTYPARSTASHDTAKEGRRSIALGDRNNQLIWWFGGVGQLAGWLVGWSVG